MGSNIKKFKSISIILLLILSIFSGFIAIVPERVEASSNWWNVSWDYRQKLTFDNDNSENLTYFPVLVHLNSSNFDFSHAQSNGEDIRFIDDDGSTELNYEIESWNSTEAFVWVNVSQIDNSSTDYIWMYYGNSGASDNQDMHGTWNSNYTMVQHLQEYNATETAIHNDSTAYGNNGTAHNFNGVNGMQNASGQIDGADLFDGYNDYVDCGSDGSLEPRTGDWTIESWFKTAASATQAITHGVMTGGQKYLLRMEDGKVRVYVHDGTSYWVALVTDTANEFNDGQWHHAVTTIDRDGDQIIYVDGVNKKSQTASNAVGMTGMVVLYIGDDWGNVFNGTIDEVRISNVSRSANWINATYQNHIGTFVTFGGEQGGYLPHILAVQSEGDYDAGQDITIFVQALNTTGEPFALTPPCDITIFSSSVAVVDSGLMSSVAGYGGMYSYTYSIPAVATEGTYFVRVTMTNATKTIVGCGSFHVAGWAGTIEDIYTYIQSKWDGYDATDLITYLTNIDANLTLTYSLLQLVDGNLTDVYNLLVLTDGNVTAVYNLLQSTDGNVTEAYDLLKQVNQTVSYINTTVNDILNKWGSKTADQIYNRVDNCYSILDYINSTIWGGIIADDILQQAMQAKDIVNYINTSRWDSYTFSDIIGKWGSYVASDIYNVANQTKNIAIYINDSRWGGVYASDLDKWGAYTAGDLYSISNQIHSFADYINSTRWGSYSASQLYSLSDQIKDIAIYINNTRWDGYNFSDVMAKWGSYTAQDIFALSNYTNNTVNDIIDKWGIYNASDLMGQWDGYTASDLYNLIDQTRDIASYINLTKWGAYKMQDLMDKWGAYNAQQLYNLIDDVKNISDFLNNSVWDGYNASYIVNLSNSIKNVADFLNNSRWGSYNASRLYDLSDQIHTIVDNVENIVTNVNSTVVEINNRKWYFVHLTDFGEINPDDKYKAYITVFNRTGHMVDADSNPLITLYDANGNVVVNNAPMTHGGTGLYSYSYTTSSGQPSGQWTTEAATTVDGRTVTNIEYWELESSPAEIKLTITDNTIPTIKAEIEITNEGDTAQEYTYYYWITPRSDGQLGDVDTIDGGGASKLINAHDTFITTVTLTVESTGTYWFKAVVFYGTEYSGACAKFTAQKPEKPKPPPAGGYGPPGVAPISAPPTLPPAVPTFEPSPFPTVMLFLIPSIIILIILLFVYEKKKKKKGEWEAPY